MKILILDYHYPAFSDSWYASHPGLAADSFNEQNESLSSSLFGEMSFEAAELRALGHEGSAIIVNNLFAQAAWARERGLSVSEAHWGVRMRRGWLPWPVKRVDPSWSAKILRAQIEDLRPDVVHVQCMDWLQPGFIKEIRPYVRLIVGQIASPISLDRVLEGYDLVVSSLPNFVERFRAAGQDSEYLALAFEPRILDAVPKRDRTTDLSFVGSVFPVHRTRAEILENVAKRLPIDIWTAHPDALPSNSTLRRRLHPPVWGASMYEVLASSVVTLNVHIDVADNYANNLRLFEATGMGAVLLTDWKANLGDLFHDGTEVVSFKNADECVERATYLLEHPDETGRIAAAGQVRTLRDHTWRHRMEQLVDLTTRRL